MRWKTDDTLRLRLLRRRGGALCVARLAVVFVRLVVVFRGGGVRDWFIVRRDDVLEIRREIRVRIQRLLFQRRAHDDRLSPSRHALSRVFADSRHVSSKVARQQIIRLVHDERSHAVRLQDSRSRQLCQTPGRADDDERSLLSYRLLLSSRVGAADGLLRDFPSQVSQNSLNLTHDLHRQLLRRRDDERTNARTDVGANRSALLVHHLVYNRQEVRQRLPRTRVRLHRDVFPSLDRRHRRSLRDGRRHDPRPFQRAREMFPHTHIRERDRVLRLAAVRRLAAVVPARARRARPTPAPLDHRHRARATTPPTHAHPSTHRSAQPRRRHRRQTRRRRPRHASLSRAFAPLSRASAPLSRARIDDRYRPSRSSPNDRSCVVPRRSREARSARIRRRCVPRRFSSESNARARESQAQCSPRTRARARRRRSRVTRARESWRRTRA